MITGSAPAALADRDLYTKSSVRPWLTPNIGVEERVVKHFQDTAMVVMRDDEVRYRHAKGQWTYSRPNEVRELWDSNRLQVRVLALEEIVVGIAHGLRLAAAEHNLEIDRL